MDNSSSKTQGDKTEIIELARRLYELGYDEALRLIQQVRQSS